MNSNTKIWLLVAIVITVLLLMAVLLMGSTLPVSGAANVALYWGIQAYKG